MITRKKILCLLSLAVLLAPVTALGLEIRYPPVPGAEAPQKFTKERPAEEHLAYFLRYIYSLVLTLSGLACFYSVASGIFGYFYFNWRGAALKSKSALNKASVGITGLVITLSSFLLIRGVNPELLKFRVGKKEVEVTAETEMSRAEYKAAYAEIPTGPLIKRVKRRAKLVRDQAAEVERVAQAVKDQADCIKKLTDQCACEALTLEGCECTEEEAPDCESCKEAECTGDPCDLRGTGCNGQSVNVRQALERARTKLSSHTSTLEVEKKNLESLKENLKRANLRLKYAEALIRDRKGGSEIYNYTRFIEKREQKREEGKEIETEQIWKFEPVVPGQIRLSQPSPSRPRRYGCDSDCRVDEAGDTTPCCWECQDTLVCFGNDFKCDQHNVDEERCDRLCASDDIFASSDWSDTETGGGARSDPRVGDTVQYNGRTFGVPVNGVYYCDLNEPGCFQEKCGGGQYGPGPEPGGPGPCQGHCPGEGKADCTLCDGGNALVCDGNDYRCCETDSIANTLTEEAETKCGPPDYETPCKDHDNAVNCEAPPPVPEQTWGEDNSCCEYQAETCHSPRQQQQPEDTTVQISKSDMLDRLGEGKESFMYNGVEYNVPEGGVYFYGPTHVNCSFLGE